MEKLSYFAAGIFALLDAAANKIFLHMVLDAGNIKFSGGRSQPSDFDPEMTREVIVHHLTNAQFSIAEGERILEDLDKKNEKLTPQERTFIREYLGETGYYPLKYDCEPFFKKGNSGEDQYFFTIKEMVEPYKGANQFYSHNKLKVVDKIEENPEFKGMDADVENPRLCKTIEDGIIEMINSHRPPILDLLDKKSFDDSKWAVLCSNVLDSDWVDKRIKERKIRNGNGAVQK